MLAIQNNITTVFFFAIALSMSTMNASQMQKKIPADIKQIMIVPFDKALFWNTGEEPPTPEDHLILSLDVQNNIHVLNWKANKSQSFITLSNMKSFYLFPQNKFLFEELKKEHPSMEKNKQDYCDRILTLTMFFLTQNNQIKIKQKTLQTKYDYNNLVSSIAIFSTVSNSPIHKGDYLYINDRSQLISGSVFPTIRIFPLESNEITFSKNKLLNPKIIKDTYLLDVKHNQKNCSSFIGAEIHNPPAFRTFRTRTSALHIYKYTIDTKTEITKTQLTKKPIICPIDGKTVPIWFTFIEETKEDFALLLQKKTSNLFNKIETTVQIHKANTIDLIHFKNNNAKILTFFSHENIPYFVTTENVYKVENDEIQKINRYTISNESQKLFTLFNLPKITAATYHNGSLYFILNKGNKRYLCIENFKSNTIELEI